MGLLQRQRQAYSTTQPLYNIGGQASFLVVGLGNIGKKYAHTRHNIGFLCLDDYAERNELPPWKTNKDLRCMMTVQLTGGKKILFVKPTTQMNLSGQSVRAVQEYYDIYNAQTVAIYDELAINFGQIRMRVGGESAGHNGVKSLIENLGEDFGRIRIGISDSNLPKTDTAQYVLKNFSKTDRQLLPLIFKETGVIINEFVFSGQLPHDTRSIV